MPTVTFILGYCGSGKTYLADDMVATHGVRKFDEGFLSDRIQHQQLIQNLRDNRDCIVIEIAYCREHERRYMIEMLNREVPGVDIEYVYFENSLLQANENCRRRKNKGDPEEHIRINTVISSGYEIPPDVTPRPIYQIPRE